MAIEDVLYGFNPMDIVRGYEYGVEKGQTREKGEEEIRRQRLANQIVELQNLKAAQFAGMQTEAKIGAFDPVRETERERLAAEAAASKQVRASAEENVLGATLPGRMRSLWAMQEGLNTPEQIDIRVEGKKAQERATGAQARVSAGQYEGMESDLKAVTEAESVLQQFAAEERQALQADPTAARLDTWEKHDRAIDRAKDPKAQQVLQQRRDQLALQALTGAAQGGDVDTMNLYLKRYGKNVEVGVVQTTDAQGQVRQAYQLFQLTPTTDAQGKTTVQRTPMAGAYFGVADNQPKWIGRYLPGLLGIAAPAPQRGQPRTTTPRVATPRAAPVPKPGKPVVTPPGEAALGTTGKPAAAATRQTLENNPDLRQHLQDPRFGGRPRSSAPLTEKISALDDNSRREVEVLSQQALVYQRAIDAGANAEVMGRLQSDVLKRIDALLAQPPARPSTAERLEALPPAA